MPPLQLEEEGDTWESWEDTDPDAIQLATTPVKETVLKSPGSPGPLKVYDGPYLLQFRAVPPNPRVKSFFPQESQHHRGKERERDHHKEKDSQEDKRDRKPRRLESRAGFGQQDTSAPRDRPFANLGITSDQRPVVIDPDAAPPTNPFFQPLPVPVRPLFGTQMAGKGGASQQTAKQQQQQRALARLERRVANPFRVNKPDNELQATVKKVQGILNKITPEKYEELFAQMWDELNEFNLYDVDDDDAMNVLDQVIGLIFEKALAEANYSKMYADIARDLCDMAIQVSQETGNSDAKPLEHFRKMLLDRCQTEFETRLTQLPADPAERYRVETRHRKRGVGNIKFIAELFKLNMLTEKIMHDVIKQLLLGPPPHSEQYLPTVEELEVLCKLWSVAGKLLDRPAALEYINYYFAIMRRHSETYPEIRLRFIVADIIDLRSNGWMPRREQGTAKKITEEGHGQGRHGAAERPRAKDGRGGAKAARGERGGDAPARPTPTALLTRPKGDARSAPSSGSPVGTGPPTTPVSGDPGPEAGLPHGKGRDRSKGGQRGKEQKARGKGQPQPVSPVVPTGPKELSGEEMDSKVLWLISEFAETQNAVELLDCLNELGAVNHPLFVARAVYRVIENHRLGDERLVLACLLEAFARAAQEKAAAKQRAAALEKGFQLALRDVFDFEAWVDSPFLWRDLSDFLVELLLKGVIQFDFLNAMFHPDTYVQFPEVLQDFIADLFSNLKAKELEWVACTGFYRILSFFPAEHLPRLLQALQDKEVIETDITLFAYRAVSSNEAVTDCFEVLESRVDAELLKSYQAVVCAKVASGVLTCISAGAAARTVQQCDADAIAAFEASALEAAKPLLARYSKCEDPEFEVRLQVTVLNELHRACSMSRFPKGHMSRMFRLLYELGVCSSFAFEDWIEGASDVPDKGKAIFEVNSFLQSLKVAEQPPADDEATDDATDEAEDDGSD